MGLLTDDAKARKTALSLGVATSGTLGLLLQAVRMNLLTINAADVLLGQMIQSGYRSPHQKISELLP